MPRRRHDLDPGTPRINLTPIMSILVILIPVLLFAFNFFQLSIQTAHAPRSGPGGGKTPTRLTVLVTGKGFAVMGESERSPRTQGHAIPKKDGRFDYASLYNVLVDKKRERPTDGVINIGAESNIPWSVVVRAADTTRYLLEEDRYESLATYDKALPRVATEAKTPVRLFDDIVLVLAE